MGDEKRSQNSPMAQDADDGPEETTEGTEGTEGVTSTASGSSSTSGGRERGRGRKLATSVDHTEHMTEVKH
jgi:hypothetical protein